METSRFRDLLGVPSPLFPGILKKEKNKTQGKQLVCEKNNGRKGWTRNRPLETSILRTPDLSNWRAGAQVSPFGRKIRKNSEANWGL